MLTNVSGANYHSLLPAGELGEQKWDKKAKSIDLQYMTTKPSFSHIVLYTVLYIHIYVTFVIVP